MGIPLREMLSLCPHVMSFVRDDDKFDHNSTYYLTLVINQLPVNLNIFDDGKV